MNGKTTAKEGTRGVPYSPNARRSVSPAGAGTTTMGQVLDRIKRQEDLLRCYITYDAEGALKQATEIQQKMDAGKTHFLLAGVPYAVKDNLCTAGIRTTCGSKMLEHFVPAYDAAVVEKCKAAGGILIGKTNMDEYAFGSSTETSYFGPTRNPAEPDHCAGGSSGGSAAAVSSGEAVFALGTDTGGSVRQPASHCGVVGTKPTYGAVSRWGLIAYASSMDTVGTLTRSVEDAAKLLEILVGEDKRDSTSLPHPRPDFTGKLPGGTRGLRIGIPMDLMGNRVSEEVAASLEEAASALRENGAEVERFELGLSEYLVPAYYLIAMAEASSNLARFDGVKYGYRTPDPERLSELYQKSRGEAFGEEVKRRIMMGTYVLSSGYYDEYYLKALKVRRLIKEAYDRAFRKYDCILSPTAPTTAPLLREKQDPIRVYEADLYTVSANLTGCPAISIPWKVDAHGLPIGVQLMADAFCEDVMLQAAYSLENLRPPMEMIWERPLQQPQRFQRPLGTRAGKEDAHE